MARRLPTAKMKRLLGLRCVSGLAVSLNKTLSNKTPYLPLKFTPTLLSTTSRNFQTTVFGYSCSASATAWRRRPGKRARMCAFRASFIHLLDIFRLIAAGLAPMSYATSTMPASWLPTGRPAEESTPWLSGASGAAEYSPARPKPAGRAPPAYGECGS